MATRGDIYLATRGDLIMAMYSWTSPNGELITLEATGVMTGLEFPAGNIRRSVKAGGVHPNGIRIRVSALRG